MNLEYNVSTGKLEKEMFQNSKLFRTTFTWLFYFLLNDLFISMYITTTQIQLDFDCGTQAYVMKKDMKKRRGSKMRECISFHDFYY